MRKRMKNNNDFALGQDLTYEQNEQRKAAIELLREIEKETFASSKQFVRTLKKLSDEIVIEEIISHVESHLDNRSIEEDYENIKSLAIGFQNLWFIWLIDAEINNGGFAQFFVNYSCKYADGAYNSFLNIGDHKLALVIQNAISAENENREYIERKRREKSLDFFNDPKMLSIFSSLDNEYLELGCEIDQKLIKYVRKNYKDFG
jgi:hypothetical protein